ncbi:MAG: hypothetical protein Q8941_14070 [Bacteroidota bacterium]|nr:hypothetical protein [Bacteroidota bacterium]
MAKPGKIIVTHPVTGSKREFHASIYDPFLATILRGLKEDKGKAWF